MSIKATQALLAAVLDGSLNSVELRTDANFGFAVPVSAPGIDARILDTRSSWADATAYDLQAKKLVSMFIDILASSKAMLTLP